MKQTPFFSVLALFLSLFLLKANNHSPVHRKPTNPKIQMALLLDTSGSMDGLIEQAKSQLWKMVNQLTTASKNGKSPDIEIALYQYGNDGLSIKDNYIQQILPLSNDLDEVSEQLFSLKTNGGSEFCGAVMLHSVLNLDWSSSDADLKMIVIAGNEPFDQGPITPNEACIAALKKGISITTIFCGDWKEGVSTHWQEGAKCGLGEYLNIDSDEKVAHIPTPYDDQILALNDSLNSTYIAYGRFGFEKLSNQLLQDANASTLGIANMRARATFKAKKQYNTSSWDLIDLFEQTGDMVGIEPEELPEELAKKDWEEIEKIIKTKSEKRAQFQSQIRLLEKKARDYEANELKKTAKADEPNTLDKVMNKAIHNLATRNGYTF